MAPAALLFYIGAAAAATTPTVLLTPHCANSIRVRIAAPGTANVTLGMVGALGDHCGVEPHRPSLPTTTGVANGNIKVEVDAGGVTVTRVSDGTVLLRGPLPTFSPAECSTGYFAIAANFTSAANAAAPPAWYGLGQIENEAQSACNDPDPSRQCGSDLNRVGQSWSILSTKYHVAIPWLFDRTAGYGVFFNQPGDGAIDLSDGGLGASFVCQPQFDMWVTVAPATGPTVAPFAAVHTQYMQAVGLPAQLPDKAMYYWQSRDAYHNSTEVIALANNFSKRKLKVGVIVLDLAIAEASPYYRLDPARFPDVPALVATVANLTGASLMPNLKPTSAFSTWA